MERTPTPTRQARRLVVTITCHLPATNTMASDDEDLAEAVMDAGAVMSEICEVVEVGHEIFPIGLPDPEVTFLRAVKEINDDIAVGRVPADVPSFSALHDHVDANGYGGLFDIDLPIGEVTDFANALQDRVDVWLKAGRPPVVI